MLRIFQKDILNGPSVKTTGNAHAKEELVTRADFSINDRWLRALQFFDSEGKGHIEKATLEHILTITCRSEKLSVGEIRYMLGLLPDSGKGNFAYVALRLRQSHKKKKSTTDK